MPLVPASHALLLALALSDAELTTNLKEFNLPAFYVTISLHHYARFAPGAGTGVPDVVGSACK